MMQRNTANLDMQLFISISASCRDTECLVVRATDASYFHHFAVQFKSFLHYHPQILKHFQHLCNWQIPCVLLQWGGPSYQGWWNWLAHFISNQSMWTTVSNWKLEKI